MTIYATYRNEGDNSYNDSKHVQYLVELSRAQAKRVGTRGNLAAKRQGVTWKILANRDPGIMIGVGMTARLVEMRQKWFVAY